MHPVQVGALLVFLILMSVIQYFGFVEDLVVKTENFLVLVEEGMI